MFTALEKSPGYHKQIFGVFFGLPITPAWFHERFSLRLNFFMPELIITIPLDVTTVILKCKLT